jgi:hypothetical protein
MNQHLQGQQFKALLYSEHHRKIKMGSSTRNVKDRVLQKLHHIVTYIHTSSDINSILSLEKNYLTPSLHCIELCLTGLNKTPVSMLILKQNFFSTKRCSSKVRLGKPTTEERRKMTSALFNFIPESELSKYDLHDYLNCFKVF